MTDEEKQKIEAAARAARIAGAGDVPSKAAGVEQEKVAAAGGGGRGGARRLAALGDADDDRGGMAGPLEHRTTRRASPSRDGKTTTGPSPPARSATSNRLPSRPNSGARPTCNVLVMTRALRSAHRRLQLPAAEHHPAEPDRSLFMVPPDYTVKDTGIRKMLEASRKDGTPGTEHLALRIRSIAW